MQAILSMFLPHSFISLATAIAVFQLLSFLLFS
jgi:hypothetical protein